MVQLLALLIGVAAAAISNFPAGMAHASDPKRKFDRRLENLGRLGKEDTI